MTRSESKKSLTDRKSLMNLPSNYTNSNITTMTQKKNYEINRLMRIMDAKNTSTEGDLKYDDVKC